MKLDDLTICCLCYKLKDTMIGRQSTGTGFTIVEILIVIVVISVLASVSVVSFSGVRESAIRSSIASSVNTWNKGFKMYLAETGMRPRAEWLCIGKAEDYPADGDFPAGVCGVASTDGGSTWTVVYSVDSSGALLSDQMAPYIADSSLGRHDVVTLTTPGRIAKTRGIVYDDHSNSGSHMTLLYYVPGDSCVTPSWATYHYNNGRICYFSLGRSTGIPRTNL